jgi:hypothetical protein
MLGKGLHAIIKKWSIGGAIQIIEYCETIEEGREYIDKQPKSILYDWDIIIYERKQ